MPTTFWLVRLLITRRRANEYDVTAYADVAVACGRIARFVTDMSLTGRRGELPPLLSGGRRFNRVIAISRARDSGGATPNAKSGRAAQSRHQGAVEP